MVELLFFSRAGLPARSDVPSTRRILNFVAID